MTYYIDPMVAKIKAPIIVRIDSSEEGAKYEDIYFENGIFLSQFKWNKPYLIEYITICRWQCSVFIKLMENNQINSTNWIGEEQVGFF